MVYPKDITLTTEVAIVRLFSVLSNPNMSANKQRFMANVRQSIVTIMTPSLG